MCRKMSALCIVANNKNNGPAGFPVKAIKTTEYSTKGDKKKSKLEISFGIYILLKINPNMFFIISFLNIKHLSKLF
jgi:hypothetical protein